VKDLRALLPSSDRHSIAAQEAIRRRAFESPAGAGVFLQDEVAAVEV
jgi:hypothetical protein